MKPVLVTTSIPYVNGDPHIGFAMELLQADVYARWLRSRGREVFFLSGTDEHGQKIVKAAKAEGLTPQQITDKYSQEFVKLAQIMNTPLDNFIRTTSPEHHRGAQQVWERIADADKFITKSFQGLYCVGCESFVLEKDLTKDGLCPNHLTPPEPVAEENIFFQLSHFQDFVLSTISSGTVDVQPEFRRREILSFVEVGLQDVSFSRPVEKLNWGVPVPNNDSQIMYIWCDALTNYLTGVGYGSNDNWQQYWEDGEVVHFVGKDILRFHAAIWPAMLEAAQLPLPSRICVHGFLTSDGQKMSKSRGNVVNPFEVIKQTNNHEDPLRFYLLHEVPIGRDADYTAERYLQMYQAFFVNGIGNLTQRLVTLCARQGVLTPQILPESALQADRDSLPTDIDAAMQDFQFNIAMARIRQSIETINEHLSSTQPWKLMKTDSDQATIILADALASLEVCASELAAFLPRTAETVLEAINTVTPPEKMFLPRSELDYEQQATS